MIARALVALALLAPALRAQRLSLEPDQRLSHPGDTVKVRASLQGRVGQRARLVWQLDAFDAPLARGERAVVFRAADEQVEFELHLPDEIKDGAVVPMTLSAGIAGAAPERIPMWMAGAAAFDPDDDPPVALYDRDDWIAPRLEAWGCALPRVARPAALPTDQPWIVVGDERLLPLGLDHARNGRRSVYLGLTRGSLSFAEIAARGPDRMSLERADWICARRKHLADGLPVAGGVTPGDGMEFGEPGYTWLRLSWDNGGELLVGSVEFPDTPVGRHAFRELLLWIQTKPIPEPKE